MSTNGNEKIRIWAWIPMEVSEEMERLRTALEFPPSKTQFLIHIVEAGLEEYKRQRGKATARVPKK